MRVRLLRVVPSGPETSEYISESRYWERLSVAGR